MGHGFGSCWGAKWTCTYLQHYPAGSAGSWLTSQQILPYFQPVMWHRKRTGRKASKVVVLSYCWIWQVLLFWTWPSSSIWYFTSSVVATSNKINTCSVFEPRSISALHMLAWHHGRRCNVTTKVLVKCCILNNNPPILLHTDGKRFVRLKYFSNTYTFIDVACGISHHSLGLEFKITVIVC